MLPSAPGEKAPTPELGSWLQPPPAFAAKAKVKVLGGKCQQMAPAASAAQHLLAAASRTASHRPAALGSRAAPQGPTLARAPDHNL